MRYIEKSAEPDSLTQWKRRFPGATYKNMQGNETDARNVKSDIRLSCTKEQYYICAYCCQRIEGVGDDTTNEHIIPQDKAPNKTLDYTNIVASCQKEGQCDKAHGSKELLLTPLMKECETEISYYLSGNIKGNTERANQLIEILNLNCKKLKEKRKLFTQQILLQESFTNEDITAENCDILSTLRDEYNNPIDGKLQPFAPVIVSIIDELCQNTTDL